MNTTVCIYRGADKSLARAGRKQATAIKLQLLQATQRKFRRLSVQPGLGGSSDLRAGRKMATFQLFFQSGRARYGLDGPGIEYRCGRDFPHLSRPILGPTQPPMGTWSFTRVKRPRRGVDHPPHLAPRLRKEYSYTSTPPLGFRALFQGELCLYIILCSKLL